MKKLLLLDGNSMLFRAYYATLYTNRMSTSQGIPTNAVYGFVMMLNKAIETIQPDGILVAWDKDSQTFRKEKYEAYKGTRKELDEELIAQFSIVREYLDAAGIKRYEVHGYEADDIIGSMSKQVKDVQTAILTGDRDLLQLIDDHTDVLLMRKGISEMDVMDTQAFMDAYDGLQPLQIIDMKGLMGDTSDNIPGVKGIGEKTAIKLLKQHPSVEEIYEHIDEQKGKLKEKLETDKDNAFLSKELATIYRDMDLPFTLEDCAFEGVKEDVNAFFVQYEMSSFIRAQKKAVKMMERKEVSTWPDTNYIIPVCSQEPVRECSTYGFLSVHDGNVIYLPIQQAQSDLSFQSVLADQSIITWNAKLLMHVLAQHDLPIPTIEEDVNLASFILHSQATNMDALVEALHLSLPETFHELSKKSALKDVDRLLNVYTAFTQQVFENYKSWLNQLKEEESYDLYKYIELPLVPILFEMEQEGIYIDADILKSIGEDVQNKADGIAASIYEMAGKEFNINSPKQLGEILYDDLGLKAGKKRSTSADVLEKMEKEHPIIPLILQYRKYAKIQSTYIDGLQKHICKDSKIHTSFNQTMTQTGRLSSSEPNLQNISIRDEQGKRNSKSIYGTRRLCLIIG